MSSTVQRVANGDVIQVRTGVLQGIGPTGATGPQGPQGQVGPQGPQGIPGPTGQIDDFLTYAHSIGNPLNVASNTPTNLVMNTVVQDDPGLVTTVTALALPVGVWYLQVSATFQKPSNVAASNWRRLAINYNGAEFDARAHNAIPTIDTVFDCRTLINVTTPGLLVNFVASHGDTVAIPVISKFFAKKLGPGAQGPAGPQGIAGPVGQTGPTGPVGPAGTILTSSNSYADLGG